MSLFSSPLRESQREPGEHETVLSIVAADLRVEGALTSTGATRIEGTVIGKVQAEPQVLVAERGIVEGDVHASEAVVDGKVTSSMLGHERVELQPSAVIEGNITTSRLLVHEGARVRGRVRMGKPKQPPTAA